MTARLRADHRPSWWRRLIWRIALEAGYDLGGFDLVMYRDGREISRVPIETAEPWRILFNRGSVQPAQYIVRLETRREDVVEAPTWLA